MAGARGSAGRRCRARSLPMMRGEGAAGAPYVRPEAVAMPAIGARVQARPCLPAAVGCSR